VRLYLRSVFSAVHCPSLASGKASFYDFFEHLTGRLLGFATIILIKKFVV